MRLVALSDTHNRHDAIVVPDGDVLVHAGDLTGRGSLREIEAAARFLRALPHPHKVVIAGNHDFGFQNQASAAQGLFEGVTYLEDTGTEIDGVRFWGSPWQPWFFDWAFNLERGEALRRVWERIPEDTDVLLTHGPPLGILDRTSRGEDVGCADLLERVRIVRPSLHVFGHIHEAYGTHGTGDTLFVNASICTLGYEPANAPIVLDRVGDGWSVVR